MSGPDRTAYGREIVDQILGPGFSETNLPPPCHLVHNETVDHLYGAIWSRPGHSFPDRRLLTEAALGAPRQPGDGGT
jgi:4-carboxymuconolactone decarboxylase